MTTPMRRLAAMLVATTLPALPATAHTGISHQRVAGSADHADAWSASASAVTPTAPGQATGPRTPVSRAMEGTRIGTVVTQASGALTVSARPATGRNAIVVDGTAPAALPVTITLTGTISRDIPEVTLSRVSLATDGNFHATLPVALAMPLGSVVTVLVTSLPGVSPATTRITVGPPFPGLDTRFDHLPKA